MNTNGQLDLIVGMLKDQGKAIAVLDKKFDVKIEDVHERINEETSNCHKRINPVESGLSTLVASVSEQFKAQRSRINWLYFIVGGLVVSGLGAMAVLLGGR